MNRGENPFDVQYDLQEMMQELVGIVRNEDEMMRATEHLKMMETGRQCKCDRVTGNLIPDGIPPSICITC